MATKTPKYEFQKKEDNDFYNIEDFNANWEQGRECTDRV